MSEINTIKTANQLELNTNRTTTAQTNVASDKRLAVPSNSAQVDTVSLTDTATQLQSLKQTLADVPVIDSDRVSAIKAAIAEGSYHIDPAELANNMINFEQRLG